MMAGFGGQHFIPKGLQRAAQGCESASYPGFCNPDPSLKGLQLLTRSKTDAAWPRRFAATFRLSQRASSPR